MIDITLPKLKSNPGQSGWNAVLPSPAPANICDTDTKVDVLVIGGGFAGLSAARQLTKLDPSLKVTVLEAERIGDGPAGRNSGFMVELPHDLAADGYGQASEADIAIIRKNRVATAFAREVAKEMGIYDQYLLDCGKINAAATAGGMHHNDDYAKHLTKLGETSKHLSASDMKDLTGSDYYMGGLFTQATTVIQPAAYIRALANSIRSKVTIHEDSQVRRLVQQGNLWRAETEKGSVTAPKVILAVNGFIQKFGYFKGVLMHILTYSSMTRALTKEEVKRLGGENYWNFTPADPMGASLRRVHGTGGDRLLIRSRFTYNPSQNAPNWLLREVHKDHDTGFKARFPMLTGPARSGIEMEYRWGGRLCLTRNDTWAFGEIEPGLISACAQAGIGTVRGTYAGIMAAELAAETGHEALKEFEEAPKAPRLPPEPFSYVGANAFIRWREFKAGKEI